MCGIAGFVNLDGEPASVGTLSAMIDIQRHRGPDDRGMRLFSLARGESVDCRGILDLSARGHQPMCNEAGTVFIAFNGEVYNAFAYTAELIETGFRFRSRTDTEVILRLYERYGFEAMLERLDGMFAIVIVDLSTREIHAARDHMGIKPFYWAQQGDTLLFASEVKSFLERLRARDAGRRPTPRLPCG